jgi:hypothetical protein
MFIQGRYKIPFSYDGGAVIIDPIGLIAGFGFYLTNIFCKAIANG